MTKIAKLTAEQEHDLARAYNEWLSIGRSCEPLDRPAATKIIGDMYVAIGEERPVVMFFSSPIMCILAYGALRALSKDESQLGSQLWSQLWSQLESQLRSQLWSQLRSQLRSQLWSQLGSQLGSQLESQLGSQLRSQLRSQLGSQLRSQLESQLGSQLGSQLRSQLWSQLRSQLWSQLDHYFGGNDWCAWEVFYDFCRRIGVNYTTQQSATLDLWLTQSQTCHWWWPYKGLVLASERHTKLHVDEQGRLHSETEAAVEYGDGWNIHALDGQRLEKDVWEKITSKTIAFAEIMAIENADIRAIALKYNPEAILNAGSKLIDISKRGNALYLIEGSELNRFLEEPQIWFLKMFCPTGRTFVEGVDPEFARILKDNQADRCQAKALGLTLNQYRYLSVEA